MRRRHEFDHQEGQFLSRGRVADTVPRPSGRDGQESGRNSAGAAVGRQNPRAAVDVVDLVALLDMLADRGLQSVGDRGDDHILEAVPGISKMPGDGKGFVIDRATASQLVIGLNRAVRIADGEPGQVLEYEVLLFYFLQSFQNLPVQGRLTLLPGIMPSAS